MLQEKVPFVSYMTMTVFSRVLQVLIPYGQPEKVEQVMQLLAATSAVWPVTGIYLARARQTIAATQAARAGGGPSASSAMPPKSSGAGGGDRANAATSAASSSRASKKPAQKETRAAAGRKSRYGVDGELPAVAPITSTHALGSDPLEATGLLLPGTARIMMVGNSDGNQSAPDFLIDPSADADSVHPATLLDSDDGRPMGPGQQGTPSRHAVFYTGLATAAEASAAAAGSTGLNALTQAVGIDTGTLASSSRQVSADASSRSEFPLY